MSSISRGLNGYFEITIGDETTVVHNSIMDSGYRILTDLLAGSGYPLTLIKVGASGVENRPTFTDLQGEIFGEKEVTGHVSSGSSVVFEAYFGYDEGNGFIREIGIFDSQGTMFARRNFSVMNKSNTEPMIVRYRITAKEGGITDGL